MLRSLFVIATVAVLSGFLSHLESVQAQRSWEKPAWVRTIDGWEPSSVLTNHSLAQDGPALHPLLVAGFELGASLFVLVAFPCPKS